MSAWSIITRKRASYFFDRRLAITNAVERRVRHSDRRKGIIPLYWLGCISF